MPTVEPQRHPPRAAPSPARRRRWLVALALYLLLWSAVLLACALDHGAADRALATALDARDIAKALHASLARGEAAERFAWALLAGFGLPLLAAASALPVLAWRSRARRSATPPAVAGRRMPHALATAR